MSGKLHSESRLAWTRETQDNKTYYYFADIGSDTDGMEFISTNIFSVEEAIITRNNNDSSDWEFVIDQEKDSRHLIDPTIDRMWLYRLSTQEKHKGKRNIMLFILLPKHSNSRKTVDFQWERILDIPQKFFRFQPQRSGDGGGGGGLSWSNLFTGIWPDRADSLHPTLPPPHNHHHHHLPPLLSR